jgi:predicted RNA methylase
MKGIPQEVLEVLSELLVVDDRKLVRITTQLDRRLYVKVDSVLKAIGGKWSRSAQGHVFDAAPQRLLDLVMMTGTAETNRDVGWFPTPAELANKMVAMAGVRRGALVLEPSAGKGALVIAAQAQGGVVTAIERDPDRRAYLARHVMSKMDSLVDVDDFMAYPGPPATFDRVVMNPPFCRVGLGNHLDHLRHAFAMLRSGGVLVAVMPSSLEFRRDAAHTSARDFVHEHGEIESLPPQSFKTSGTDVNTCLVRMTK